MRALVGKSVWIIISLSVFFYAGTFFYADISKISLVFQDFDWKLLPIILSLVLLGYIVRIYRWNYYLKKLKISIEPKMSVLIFISGLSMSITPAKSGELIKSYLLKKQSNIEVSRSAPIIFTERLTDLAGMAALSLLGLFYFDYEYQAIVVTILFIFLIVLFIQNDRLCSNLIAIAERLPKIGDKVDLKGLYYNSRFILSFKPLLFGILLSTLSWFFEGLSFFIILKGLNIDINLFYSISIFSLSSILGIATMIPGGLGITEGSIIGLLMIQGISHPSAVFSTLLIRICTLWFAFGIGLVALRYVTTTRVSNKII